MLPVLSGEHYWLKTSGPGRYGPSVLSPTRLKNQGPRPMVLSACALASNNSIIMYPYAELIVGGLDSESPKMHWSPYTRENAWVQKQSGGFRDRRSLDIVQDHTSTSRWAILYTLYRITDIPELDRISLETSPWTKV